jgi:hypothetical protein
MVEDAERKSRKLHGAEKKDSVDPSRSLETTPKTNDLPSPSSFNEESSVTAAALLNLVRLLGGELVLVRGLEVGKFEHAVRKAGIARARHLVEQVLTQIRAQAEVKSSLTVAKSQERNSLTSAPSPAKALN